jgi:transcriptional regulator with XRE-family HTH domain
MTQRQLADAAQVSLQSVKNFERGSSDPRGSTLARIEEVLQNAGVVFLDPSSAVPGGYGVRLR